VLRPSAQISYC